MLLSLCCELMYYSACMESSENSAAEGRVHLHLYLSWHKAGSTGIDHQKTIEWIFQGVRPRVDCNTEARSHWQWLRAAHHGHWYECEIDPAEIFSCAFHCDVSSIMWKWPWTSAPPA